MEFQAEFTPLYPGTIRDLFSPKRNMPVKIKGYDPPGLPSVASQCVHITVEELISEGYSYVSCLKDAVRGRHGWLCSEHGADYQRRQHRDKDAEIIPSIVAHERRALASATKEVVEVGAKIKIEYITSKRG